MAKVENDLDNNYVLGNENTQRQENEISFSPWICYFQLFEINKNKLVSGLTSED